MASWRVLLVFLAGAAAVDNSKLASITCPDGYEIVEDDTKTVTITCPNGYHRAEAEEASNTLTITCPDGYQMVGRDCFFISTDTHSGSSADQYCKESGGRAAVIESQLEWDLLKETLLVNSVYLGVSMQEYRKYQFQFALKMAGHTGFTAFGAGQPDNYGSEDCILADSSDGFAWKDVHCTELYPVLCKAATIVDEKEPSCGEGVAWFDEATCFWLDVSTLYNWTEAEDKCKSRGMELASVHSQQEHDFLVDLISRSGIYATLWIGLSDIAAEGVYEWSDGSSLNYLNWGEGQPSHGSEENCVCMSTDYDGLLWDDINCSRGFRVACRGSAP